MILVDANLLIYAINADSPDHAAARHWWESTLSRGEEVGLAWVVILAFLRITTRAGILGNPLSADRALAYIDEWLDLPNVSLVQGGTGHWQIFRRLQLDVGTAGNLTSDTHLAALAIELGAAIYSADYDYQRYPALQHINPLQPAGGAG